MVVFSQSDAKAFEKQLGRDVRRHPYSIIMCWRGMINTRLLMLELVRFACSSPGP